MTSSGKIPVTSLGDLVVMVTYVLGIFPADALVCLVLADGRLQFAARLDLPAVPEDPSFEAAAAHTATVIAPKGSRAILLGYGPADQVDPAIAAFAAALNGASVTVTTTLRVDADRYWCLCGDPGCDNGVAYDPMASPVAAAAVFHGLTALPDRAALADLLAPTAEPQ